VSLVVKVGTGSLLLGLPGTLHCAFSSLRFQTSSTLIPAADGISTITAVFCTGVSAAVANPISCRHAVTCLHECTQVRF